MGVRVLPEIVHHAKQMMTGGWRRSSPFQKSDVPKGHFAVYVGDEEKNKRFVVPIAYLKDPLFQGLLRRAAEEFGYDRPAGGLVVPCAEDEFLNLTSRIHP